MNGSDLSWLPKGFPEGESMLCTRSFLTEEMGSAVLDAAIQEFDTKEKWESYRLLVREKILEGAGLKPFPKRTPLNTIIHSRRVYDGFSVENIGFESVPGVWVTGNLYRPLEINGKAPAILTTHGHARKIEVPEDWLIHGRFHEQAQRRGMALAKMGAVVLTIDMFGYGDGNFLFGRESHKTEVTMPIQIWNTIRSVDFLESLEEVDASRIGVTGYSGGGTQAFLLTAIDDRISAYAPVAMVSAHFFGGCPCESGRPIHRSQEHFVNNAMIAVMAAPRPMLLISNGGDWTLNTPNVEYPFARSIYSLYGAGDKVSYVHLPDEGHDYGPSKRKAMYPFFARNFGLDLSAIQNASGEIDDSSLPVEPPSKLHVFDEKHPIPADAARNADAVKRILSGL